MARRDLPQMRRATWEAMQRHVRRWYSDRDAYLKA